MVSTFKEYLSEASLGRIFKHVEDGKAIVSLTAFRGNLSLEENRKNNLILANLIRKAGYGFNKIEGHYSETGIGDVVEESFFVVDNQDNPEKLKTLAIAIGKKFNQDSIFYRSPEGVNYLISTNKTSDLGPIGTQEKLGTGFSPMKMNVFYSKIKGRPYVFESVLEESEASTGYTACVLREKIESFLAEYGEDAMIKYTEE